MQTVTSDAVYNALSPTSTTIIEGDKRTVSVTNGYTTWWGMTQFQPPSVPSGKRLIRMYANCDNQHVSVCHAVSNGENRIITISEITASIQIWFCIEVADI